MRVDVPAPTATGTIDRLTLTTEAVRAAGPNLNYLDCQGSPFEVEPANSYNPRFCRSPE
jgi:hypothetical protein